MKISSKFIKLLAGIMITTYAAIVVALPTRSTSCYNAVIVFILLLSCYCYATVYLYILSLPSNCYLLASYGRKTLYI